MSEQKVIALCLFDAAFNAIDNSILLHRLSSWFGLDGTVISWLRLLLIYHLEALSSLNSTSSAQSPLLQGVP